MNTQIFSVHDVSKLERRRFRDEAGVFTIEGKKVFEEAVAAKLELRQLFVTEKFAQQQAEFLRAQKVRTLPITYLSEKNMERLADTATPSGILAVVKKPLHTLSELFTAKSILVCEDIRDPGNMGTILRTADWFGIQDVVVSDDSVDPFHPKVVRASMGSLFHLRVVISAALISDCTQLKAQGFMIIVSRPEARAEALLKVPQKFAFVLGNESRGTSPEIDALADLNYSIPRYGKAESLNVGVSFGIMMSELAKASLSPAL